MHVNVCGMSSFCLMSQHKTAVNSVKLLLQCETCRRNLIAIMKINMKLINTRIIIIH